MSLIRERILASFGLRKSIRQACVEERVILIQGLSPALYAIPLTLKKRTCLVLDWTPSIYENSTVSFLSRLKAFLYKPLLKRQEKIFCFTHSVIDHLKSDFSVEENKLVYLPVPFSYDLSTFSPTTSKIRSNTKLLFVGGDILRKGGDKLTDWFTSCKRSGISLTFVSGNQPEVLSSNITYIRGLKAGTEEHAKLFADHDILVLPTMADSYPVVLAEAAASGLAIVTTKFALGAPEIIEEGINGFICEDQNSVFERVLQLIDNPELLRNMKRSSRLKMERDFNESDIKNYYKKVLFPSGYAS